MPYCIILHLFCLIFSTSLYTHTITHFYTLYPHCTCTHTLHMYTTHYTCTHTLHMYTHTAHVHNTLHMYTTHCTCTQHTAHVHTHCTCTQHTAHVHNTLHMYTTHCTCTQHTAHVHNKAAWNWQLHKPKCLWGHFVFISSPHMEYCCTP